MQIYEGSTLPFVQRQRASCGKLSAFVHRELGGQVVENLQGVWTERPEEMPRTKHAMIVVDDIITNV